MSKSVLLLQMIDVLKDRPGLTIGELASRLGRSERTVYRYLESLSGELHVPVYCRQGAYYLAERSVASKLDLSAKEILAIRLAITSGALSKGGPFAEYTHSAWKKIEAALISEADFVEIRRLCVEQGVNIAIGHSDGRYLTEREDIPLIRIGFPILDRKGGQRLLSVGYVGTALFMDRITNTLIENKYKTYRSTMYDLYYKNAQGQSV
jgi:hypothetical protein